MGDIEISRRAREIEREFESMPRAAEFDLAQERLNTKDAHVLTGVPQDVSMERETVAGTSCIRMRPRDARADREVVFLHGGAYCLMSAMTHHRFGGHIANAAEADVIIPDYALAPEAPFPVARDECLAVVRDRLAAGPGHFILAGDSAGGGLALSVACALRDAGESSSGAIVLMSPWLELSLRNLKGLVSSIREKGIIQSGSPRAPPRDPGRYEIVAGEALPHSLAGQEARKRDRIHGATRLHELPGQCRDSPGRTLLLPG